MRIVSGVVLALSGVGCSSDLVRGGTSAQEDAVFATLQEMEEAAGREIALASVSFRDVSRAGGKYNAVTRQISLDADLTGDSLVSALRHELCHAMDFQFDFGSAGRPEWRIGHEALQYGSRRRQAREAFAMTCGVAPLDNALTLACGTSELDAEVQRMSAEVLGENVPVAELTPRWHGETTLPEGESMRFAGVTSLGNVRIHGESVSIKTDLTGEPAPTGIGDPTLASEPVGGSGVYAIWRFARGTRVSEGIEAGIAERDIVDGSTLRQLMILGDEGIEATACASETDLWFVWEEQVWLVRQEGRTVRWGPLVPVEAATDP